MYHLPLHVWPYGSFYLLQSGYGNRTYSWDNKLVFALKPAELGNFLDDNLVAKGFDLFHDPDMGTPVGTHHIPYNNQQQQPIAFFYISYVP